MKAFLQKHFLIVALILLTGIGFLCYGSSLKNNFILDDTEQIINNPLVHSLTNFFSFFRASTFNSNGAFQSGIYYKPLLSTVFSLVYVTFGQNPYPFHVLQLIVHIINAGLILILFSAIFPATSGLVPLCLSIIFLVHPANSESVLYISALQEPLSFLFGISAFLLWIKLPSQSQLKSILIIALLLLSILTKEAGFLFLVILPIYDLFHRKKPVGSLGVSGITLLLYSFLRFGISHLSLYPPTISSQITKLPLLERLMHIPFIITYYLRILFYPKSLYSMFSTLQSINFNTFGIPLIIIALFIMSAAIIYWKFLKQSSTKNIYLFFSCWLIIGLGFHLQIVPLDMTATPRWLYFPIVGLLGMFGIIIIQIFEYKKIFLPVILILLLAISCILSIRTMRRIYAWKNEFTLVSEDIKDNSNDYYLEDKFAIALERSGHLEQAESQAKKSIAIYPNASNWHTLGIIYLKKNETDRAIESFITSTKYGVVYSTYFDLPAATLLYKEPQSAQVYIQRSLQYFPNSAQLWLLDAIVKEKLGKHDEAIKSIKKSYDLSPSNYSYEIYTTLLENKTINIPFSIN